jgi:hypothetical protein
MSPHPRFHCATPLEFAAHAGAAATAAVSCGSNNSVIGRGDSGDNGDIDTGVTSKFAGPPVSKGRYNPAKPEARTVILTPARKKIGQGRPEFIAPDGTRFAECTPIRNFKAKCDIKVLKPAADVKPLKRTTPNKKFIARINNGTRGGVPSDIRKALARRLEEFHYEKDLKKLLGVREKFKPPTRKREKTIAEFDTEIKQRLGPIKTKITPERRIAEFDAVIKRRLGTIKTKITSKRRA